MNVLIIVPLGLVDFLFDQFVNLKIFQFQSDSRKIGVRKVGKHRNLRFSCRRGVFGIERVGPPEVDVVLVREFDNEHCCVPFCLVGLLPMAKKWSESNYVKAHQLSSQGLSKRQIAETLGVEWRIFVYWLRTKPALREAIESARKPNTNKHTKLAKQNNGEGFVDYVYRQLPDHLRKLWGQLESWDSTDDPSARKQNYAELVDRLFEVEGGKEARQSLWFHALVSSNFNANEACRKVNVSQSVVQNKWKKEPHFNELLRQLPLLKRAFAEGALMRLVAGGDTSATIFACKCLLPEIYNPTKNVNINGTVKGMIGHVDVTDVIKSMSIDRQKEVLEAMRQAKQLPAHEEVT